MKQETALPATGGERTRPSGPSTVPVRVWDPDGPTGSALSQGVWDALRDAVLAAHAGWESVVEHAASPDEVAVHVAGLGTAIRAAAVGQDPDLGLVPRSALSRRLVAVIRGALLERLELLHPSPEPAEMLRVLTAVERVAQRLDVDWSQRFADRLSAPDGLELVVEVAHDLRSPLTSILFLAETLQRARSGPVTPVQERQLGLIYSAAFGLSSVASDVIELARGGDRLVDLDPIPFSITDILESVRDIVLPIAEEKSLEVRVARPEADFRIGHPVALSRVLLNLTTNALKFTAEGHVEVAAQQLSPSRVEFAVRDTGRGIPPQSMAMLFEPFRRRQKQGEYAFSGSGLGLSICRKLVEAMGSTLNVETAPDWGTRFFFALELPLAGTAHPA
ncbi:MAG: sensor histidine kinase [Gemmatimonadales bacterium]